MRTASHRDLLREAVAAARGEPRDNHAEVCLLLGKSEDDFRQMVDSAGELLFREAVVDHLASIRQLLELISRNTKQTGGRR